MRKAFSTFSLLLTLLLVGAIAAPAAGQRFGGGGQTAPGGDGPLDALTYRYIGPVGNRVSAVVGVPGDANVYYIGAASGGIFRSRNGGVSWEPIFDDQPAAAIGSLAVDPVNTNVIWAGTGETFIRSNILTGNGIYKSVDGGDTFMAALPAFSLPVIILGGIFGGFVTATEAAGLAVIAAALVGLWYGQMDLKHLRRAMLDGGMQTAVVMLLVAASVLMGGFLTRAQVPQQLAANLLDFTTSKWQILLILNFFFLVIGFFLHSAAAIILVVPIVVPLIAAAGIDPVHFGLVVTLNLAIGQQTPPVASVLITACAVARANIWEVSKINVYFVAVLFVVLMICTYVPAIPMFLVEYFYR